MNKWIWRTLIITLTLLVLPTISSARGTRYFINWPAGHVGLVYVQVYDIRCYPPYETRDNFKVWVTWGCQTKCYKIGNRGTYLLQFFKDQYNKGPMIISGNASSFKVRYSMVPPWI